MGAYEDFLEKYGKGAQQQTETGNTPSGSQSQTASQAGEAGQPSSYDEFLNKYGGVQTSRQQEAQPARTNPARPQRPQGREAPSAVPEEQPVQPARQRPVASPLRPGMAALIQDETAPQQAQEPEKNWRVDPVSYLLGKAKEQKDAEQQPVYTGPEEAQRGRELPGGQRMETIDSGRLTEKSEAAPHIGQFADRQAAFFRQDQEQYEDPESAYLQNRTDYTALENEIESLEAEIPNLEEQLRQGQFGADTQAWEQELERKRGQLEESRRHLAEARLAQDRAFRSMSPEDQEYYSRNFFQKVWSGVKAGGKNAVAFFGKTGYGALNFLFGRDGVVNNLTGGMLYDFADQIFGEGTDPFGDWNARANVTANRLNAEAAHDTRNDKAAEIASKITNNLAIMAPYAALMAVSGGTAAPALASTQGLEYAAAVGSASSATELAGLYMSQTVRLLAANPAAQYTYITQFADSAVTAREEGADPLEALLYATVNAGVNTAIEMSGGYEGNGALGWAALKPRELVRTMLEETGEEEAQGFYERLLKSLYKPVEIYSNTNPDALINPNTALETAVDTIIATPFISLEIVGLQQGFGRVAAQVDAREQRQADRIIETMDEAGARDAASANPESQAELIRAIEEISGDKALSRVFTKMFKTTPEVALQELRAAEAEVQPEQTEATETPAETPSVSPGADSSLREGATGEEEGSSGTPTPTNPVRPQDAAGAPVAQGGTETAAQAPQNATAQAPVLNSNEGATAGESIDEKARRIYEAPYEDEFSGTQQREDWDSIGEGAKLWAYLEANGIDTNFILDGSGAENRAFYELLDLLDHGGEVPASAAAQAFAEAKENGKMSIPEIISRAYEIAGKEMPSGVRSQYMPTAQDLADRAKLDESYAKGIASYFDTLAKKAEREGNTEYAQRMRERAAEERQKASDARKAQATIPTAIAQPPTNINTQNAPLQDRAGQAAAPTAQTAAETETPSVSPAADSSLGEGATGETGLVPRDPSAALRSAQDDENGGNGTGENGRYAELGEQYGTIEAGENPARESAVPRQIDETRKTGETARTIYEAEATPERRLSDIRSAVIDGKFAYVSIDNETLAKQASDTIKRDGWEAALRDWTADVRAGKANENLVAMGATLLNNAANSDMDGKTYVDLATDYNRLCHALGRGLAAARILKTLSPEAKLYGIQKSISRMNEELAGGQKGAENVAGAQEAMDRLERAKDAAMENTQNAVEDPAGEAAKLVAEAVKRKVDSAAYAMTKDEPEAKPKTPEQQMADYAIRLAKEKLNIPKRATTSETATDVLRMIAQNENTFREIYEKAQEQYRGMREDMLSEDEDRLARETDKLQGEDRDRAVDEGLDKIAEREEIRETASEPFQNTPVGLDNARGSVGTKTFAKAIAESAVRTGETTQYIQAQTSLGVSSEKIAAAIANDLIQKTGASGQLADSILEGARAYVNEAIQKDSKVGSERVSSTVSKYMREIGRSFRELASESRATKESVEQDLADIIATDYAVDPSSAKAISRSIVAEYQAQLEEAVQKELNRRFGEKTLSEKEQATMRNKLAEAMNLGAFDSQYAGKAIEKIFGVKNKVTLDPKLVEEYMQAETDAERDEIIGRMQQNIADQIPSTLYDKWVSLRYLNMLGNFKTQIRNVLGNITMMATASLKNHLVRGGLENIAYGVNRAAAKATGGKVKGAFEREVAMGFDRHLYADAWADFKNVEKEALGEKRYSDSSRQFDKEIQDKRRIWKNNGTWGTEEGSNALLRSLPMKGVRKGADLLMGGLNAYSKLTEAAMEYGDQIFSRMTYADAMASWMKAHKVKHLADMSPEMLERARMFAIQEAQEATFRDSNGVSSWFSKAGRGAKTPFGKFMEVVGEGIMPFRKTPANVLVRGFEYSPLGILSTGVNAIKAIKGTADGHDVINSLSKTFTGTGLAYLGYLLAAAGLMRTKDDDDKLEKFNKDSGQLDYSINIGGKSITLDWLAPDCIPLFMGAAFQSVTADGGFQADDALKILGQLTEPMLEMSMLSGVQDAIEGAKDYSGTMDGVPMLVLNSLLSWATQGVSNSLVRQGEQASEQYRRQSYTSPDNQLPTGVQRKLSQYFSGIPGYDYQQVDYIDAWGRRQDQGSQGARIAQSLFNPANISPDRSTPYDEELRRLYKNGNTGVLPQAPAFTAKVNDTRLTPEEWERYATVGGEKRLELIGDFLDSEEYKKLDDDTRAEIIGNLYQYSNWLAGKEIAESRGEEWKPGNWGKVERLEKAGVDPADYLLGRKQADTDGNDSLSQKEVFSWLLGSDYSNGQKRTIWNETTDGSTSWDQYRDKHPAAILAGLHVDEDRAAAIATEINGGKEDWSDVSSLSNEELYDYYAKHPDQERYVKALYNAKGSDTSWDEMVEAQEAKDAKDPVNVLTRDFGYSQRDAERLWKDINTDRANGVSQAEFYSFYQRHPELQDELRAMWAAHWPKHKGIDYYKPKK